MTKTVLFVTYGGGHAAMVAPVIYALANYPNIRTETLALTIAGPYFKSKGLPYKGYKDFVTPEDREAIEWGKKLAARFHQPKSGIEEEEAIAYLGLSYWDLVTRHGAVEAAKLWDANQRNSFLQLTVMERIIAHIKPDMVVTTNSPRSEKAAVLAANKRGIPTLSMIDLFGIGNPHKMEADYISVLSQIVIDNIKRTDGIRPGQQFLITGNPAFDQAFDYRGPINKQWRHEHFPSLPADAKALLWIDDSGYIDQKTKLNHMRTEEEITKDLDTLAQAANDANGYLLIRPHPSQPKALFHAWIKRTAHSHVLFAGDVLLYPLLNACDAVATYTSTVGCEALLMERPVVQLGYYPGELCMRLGEWGLAEFAATPAALSECVRKAFYDNNSSGIRQRVAQMFPHERAAPKIAQAINNIVFPQADATSV